MLKSALINGPIVERTVLEFEANNGIEQVHAIHTVTEIFVHTVALFNISFTFLRLVGLSEYLDQFGENWGPAHRSNEWSAFCLVE